MSENEAIKTCGRCRYHIGMSCHLPKGTIIMLPEKEACRHFIPKPKLTIFYYITQSVEALADEFVDAMYDRVAGEYRYYSMLTAEFYDSRKEAIAATVEKLKKEYKG